MKNPDLNKVKVEKTTSVFDLISKKSKAACFAEEKLSSFIKEFNVHISNWGDEIKKAYSIDVDENIESYYVPNRSKLGDWLEKIKIKIILPMQLLILEITRLKSTKHYRESQLELTTPFLL
ncbi:hypothetical protein ACWAU3_17915 [Shewanella sp. JL219SE-S6]